MLKYLDNVLGIVILVLALVIFVLSIIGIPFYIKKIVIYKGYSESEARKWFWMGLLFQFPILLCLISLPTRVKNQLSNVNKDNKLEDSAFDKLLKLEEGYKKNLISKEEYEKMKQFYISQFLK